MPYKAPGLTGSVIFQATGSGLKDLRLEAWDAAGLLPDLVDVTLTDADGRFEMDLAEDYLRRLFPDRHPELFFRVFQDRLLIAGTENSVTWRPGSTPGRIRIFVDRDNPPPGRIVPADFVVRGRVAHAVDGPRAGLTVRAFHRELNRRQGLSEIRLGEVETDDLGRYQISYRLGSPPGTPRVPGGLKANLLLRAFEVTGRPRDQERVEKQLAESPVRYQAPPTATVDLVFGGDAYRGPAEHETLARRLKPALGGLGLAELSDEMLDHAAQSARLEAEQARSLRRAEKAARAGGLPAELFFALDHAGLPTDLDSLAAHDTASWRRAVEGSLADNRIPARLGAEVDSLVGQLTAKVVDHAFSEQGRTASGNLLATSSVSTQTQKRFLAQYLERTGPLGKLWDSLRQGPNFKEREVEDLRLTLQLGMLTQNNLPLLQEIKELRDRGRITGLRDLGSVDWPDLLRRAAGDGGEVTLPPHIPGRNAEERVDNYVRGITEPLHALFPGDHLRRQLAASPAVGAEAKSFLARNPDLDLRTTRLDETILRDLSEQGRGNLRAIQRVSRITTRGEHASALLEHGLDSARRIARMPRKQFLRRFDKVLGGAERAGRIHRRATLRAAAGQAAWVSAKQVFTEYVPWAIAGDAATQGAAQDEIVEAVADLDTLFGNQMLCECRHCRSVYSPAAYLVDLLRFLDPAGGPKSVDVLLARRPDLQHVALTCDNTNTPIPYVDLVNEVLESYLLSRFVEPIDATPQIPAHDTGGATAAELRAVPQQVNDDAYLELAGAVHPMTLSFHRPLEVIRTYLEHLGTSRWQIMETFGPAGEAAARDTAAERLGLSPAEVDLVVGTGPVPEPWKPYGYDEDSSPGWLDDLARVPVFLQRTGLEYGQLIELLDTRFLNPEGDVVPVAVANTDGTAPRECDLDQVVIRAPNEDALEELFDRTHRFVRLGRRTGWSIAELDRTLHALGATELDGDVLLGLAQIRQLVAELRRTPLRQLLTCWSAIDGRGPDALYFELFHNRAVAKLEDQKAFELATGGHELADPDQPLDAHLPAVLAGLRIDAGDLELLRAELADDKLNLANLSVLYRHVTLARALRLRIPELLSLRALSGIDPFQPADTGPTVELVAIARRVRETSFSIRHLDYLYRHHTEPARSPQPSQQRVRNVLRASWQTLVDFEQQLEVTEVPEATGENEAETTAETIDHLRRGVVIHALADALRLDDPAASLLLETPAEGDDGATAIDAYLALAELGEFPPDSDPLPEPLPAAERTYYRLHKAATLISGFALDERELAALLDGSLVDDFNLVALPLAAAGDPVALFGQWQRLADFAALRDRLPRGEVGLVDVFAAGTANLLDVLAEATGWDRGLLGSLAGPQVDELRDPQRLLEVERARSLVRRTGAAVETLVLWASQPPDAAQAREVVQAVKSRYDHERWLEVARGLNDRLRDAQRAALVSYLLPRLGLVSSSQLFGYLLIDPEMSPCMLTSRIKQAISAVQVFVQRCLLNLEQDVAPDAVDASEWKWRKSYRVWEANRKVFLYPENWIEPELRLDKSPPFQELENELLQNELTTDNVEKTLGHFLEKLDEVANLAICGMYWQRDSAAGIDALHVFGRTRSAPHLWFYRRWLDRREWTPWEPVDLDIQSDHLIPVVYHGRLYLFWAIFATKPIAGQDSAGEGPAKTFWDIRIAWSQYRHGRWSRKRTSSDSIKSYPWQLAVNTDTVPQAALPPAALTSDDYVTIGSAINWGFPSDQVQVAAIEAWFLSYADWLANWHLADYPLKPPDGLEIPSISFGFSLKTSDLDDWFEQYKIWAVGYTVWLENHPEAHTAPQTTSFLLGLREPARHTVRLQPSRKTLSVECLVQVAANVARASVVGRFTMSYCNGDLETISTWSSVAKYSPAAAGAFTTAKHAQRLWYMGLLGGESAAIASKPSSTGGLITPSPGKAQFQQSLLDFTPEIQVLNRAGSGWHLLPPHQRLFQYPHPFFFTSKRRTYFAHPVLHGRLDLKDLSDYPRLTGPPRSIRSNPFVRSHRALVSGALAGSALADSRFDRLMPAGEGLTAGFTGLDQDTFSLNPDLRPTIPAEQLRFATFQHPAVCEFVEALLSGGVAGLLTLANQSLSEDRDGNSFEKLYHPTVRVASPRPAFEVDFEPGGAYSLYNWELFFHIPLLIAARLNQDQRYEESQRWFHHVFDPTTDSGEEPPRRFWKFRPFYDNTEYQRVRDLLLALSDPEADEALREKVRRQIEDWEARPFEPHRIARLRLVAYQKTVVMKYVDNLIDWADMLFRRDSIESINEATQLYVLAANILGRRPRRVPPAKEPGARTFAEIRERLDDFSNALVKLENDLVDLPYSSDPPADNGEPSGLLGLGTLYFCTPENTELLKYWDTVEDRLFKIRHCLNIEGVARRLPLFEPPIDPALLVRAVAKGKDISTVLADLHAPLPHYRFTFLVQKAFELTSELKVLGATLLSTLEKRDAEALAALRAGHESTVLAAVGEVRKKQVKEAESAIVALERGREVTAERHRYYRDLVRRSLLEKKYLDELDTAQDWTMVSHGFDIAANVLGALPDVTTGTQGLSLIVTAEFGSTQLIAAAKAMSAAFRAKAGHHSFKADMASIRAGWLRRDREWSLQERLAERELAQVDEQIAAARVRLAIAEQEVANHQLQVENAAAVEEFLGQKYTNQELYGWMVSQISGVYFQAYKLAYDLSRRAELAYRYERGLTSSDYVRFGYWDSLRKGLLAGERLALDLKRLESAHLEQNRREYELTRHVSLVLHDPAALIELKQAGRCEVVLPESFFDADYPGHYFRRLRTMSLTIPCVAGPYTSINCTLTLLKNKVRIDPTASGDYGEQQDADDPRFLYHLAAVQSIATSHGRNDAGLFELDFRDERYLPFEGAGALSRWRIDLPRDTNAFDFDTISDVILTMSYTAREGGEPLRQAAQNARDKLWSEAPSDQAGPQPPLQRLFSARHEFPGSWQQLLHPSDPQAGHSLDFTLTPEHFPYRFRGQNPDVWEVHIVATPREGAGNIEDLTFELEIDGQEPQFENDGLPLARLLDSTPALTSWSLTVKSDSDVSVSDLDDLWVLLVYSTKAS